MIVGIDLGTTNTVVAFAGEAARSEPSVFEVRQLIDAGQLEGRAQLPSFLYAPVEGEALAEGFALGGGSGGVWVAGVHARARAAEAPNRSVSSAKSWLCHGGVDRRAAILPWELAGDPAEGEGHRSRPRISPLTASALLLDQVKRAWDASHPNEPLAAQKVVLTVPASFDAVARQLTVEAAQACGLEVRLLEEPQAAFYDLMRVGGDDALARTLGPDEEGDGEAQVLVCDVGGGTTDLSLMRVRRGDAGDETDGVEVDRVAVGRHLLLGGDNMDLALAHLVEPRLVKREGDRLDPKRFSELVARCRVAKEQLLGDEPPDAVAIALASRGSQLVGGALRAELSRDEVERVVLEGFFPEVELQFQAGAPRTGIVAFGLPYERDVAITRHLASFVQKHVQAEGRCALLLNGGVFRAPRIAARVREVLSRWTGGRVLFLEHTDPDTSVALGAVAYGMALEGRARKIGGGAARSYWMGVAGAGESQALCVLSKGAEQGARHRAEKHPLELMVGRKVRFDLYASDEVGAIDEVVTIDDRYERLAPLVTTLSSYSDADRVGVVLEAELSAIGTLELSAVTADGARAPRRFALAFELRQVEGAAAGAAPAHEEASAAARYGKRLDDARDAIEHVYGKKHRAEVAERDVKGLIRTLEKILGKRAAWDATLTRTLFDVVWSHHKARRVTPEHERMFWMLAGYCLRPGVGHARDEERVRELFGLFDQRLVQAKELRGWQQFWIAWRRVSAGLDDEAQRRVRDAIDPFLAPAERGLKKPKPFRNDATWEMLELGASLGRAAAERRGELGGWILERTWTERDPRLWSALGKVGARVPMAGSAHHVVAARTIERWMDHLLREKWEQIPTAPRAAVAMCRVTGDRARDVADATRTKVAERLTKLGVEQALIKPVRELVALDDADRADFYGEGLPPGLRFAG